MEAWCYSNPILAVTQEDAVCGGIKHFPEVQEKEFRPTSAVEVNKGRILSIARMFILFKM